MGQDCHDRDLPVEGDLGSNMDSNRLGIGVDVEFERLAAFEERERLLAACGKKELALNTHFNIQM